MSRKTVFLDSETTGLDETKHEVWEVAWAVGNGEIQSGMLTHCAAFVEPEASLVNRYDRRFVSPDHDVCVQTEKDLRRDLHGSIIVGANPDFDKRFLQARWGRWAEWHYRSIDVESMAITALDLDRPPGMFTIWQELVQRGFLIPEPDHSAAGDVASLRAIYNALRSTMLIRQMNVERRAKGWDV